LVAVPSVVSADTFALQPYPGIQQVASAEDEGSSSRRLMLGSLKKIKNVLEPEKVDYVVGSRSSRTFYAPDERRTDVVLNFYRDQLIEIGDILFECTGRKCGSSNYWANSVFSQSILYGPEQFQHYLLVKLTGTGNYVAVYVAMRGTKKLYIHIEHTISSAQDIGAQLLAQGRYVFDSSDPGTIAQSLTALLEGSELSIQLVIHQAITEARSVEELIALTQTRAEKIRETVMANGIASARIEVSGLGPLAPSNQYGANRVEVLLLHNLPSTGDTQ
jgi:hypothetical protein